MEETGWFVKTFGFFVTVKDGKSILVFQIILPILFGAISGLATVLWSNIKKKETTSNRKKAKFAFFGGLAGFLAVNLLNPSGTFEQVTTIAILAGLNGMTYLTRNSFVDGNMEKEALAQDKEEVAQLAKDFNQSLYASTIEKKIEGLYNEDEGDDRNGCKD